VSLTPKQKYSMQKTSAEKRGIAWQFTFDEWFNWWQATGHWDNRGCKKGQYVMARFEDKGPYAINNVFCCSVEQNNSDRHKFNSYVKAAVSKAQSKPIMTPEGLFPSKILAANYYGLNSAALSYRLTKYPKEFYYVIS
jgi:hypothetical protein